MYICIFARINDRFRVPVGPNLPRKVPFLLHLRFIHPFYRGDFSPLHLIHLQLFDLINEISEDKIDNPAFFLLISMALRKRKNESRFIEAVSFNAQEAIEIALSLCAGTLIKKFSMKIIMKIHLSTCPRCFSPRPRRKSIRFLVRYLLHRGIGAAVRHTVLLRMIEHVKILISPSTRVDR